MNKNTISIPKEMRTYSPGDFENIIHKVCKEIDFDKAKNVIENNVVHSNESVYDHTLDVVSKFIKYLELAFIKNPNTKKLAKSYFSQRISKLSRAELFVISAYIHDIGKKDVLQRDGSGKTSTPGHEKISAEISRKVLSKLEFDSKDIEYIYNIIKLHSGFSLRFLGYLQALTQRDLVVAVGRSLLLPEILLYQIVDNKSASIFRKYEKLIMENMLQIEELYITSKKKSKSKVSLNGIFDRVRNKINLESKPWPEEARMLHLSEEVGELHDIYLQVKGAKDREQTLEHIKGALNDIMFELIALYDLYGLDIADSLEEELNKNE